MSKLLPYSANPVDLDQWRYYYNQLLFVDTPLSADFVCDERSSDRPKAVSPNARALSEKASRDRDAQKTENSKKLEDAARSVDGSSVDSGLADDVQPTNQERIDNSGLIESDLTVSIANGEQESEPDAKVPNIHTRAFLNSYEARTNFIGCTTVVDLFPIGIA